MTEKYKIHWPTSENWGHGTGCDTEDPSEPWYLSHRFPQYLESHHER